MIWYNLKIVFRNLIKNKLYSLLSIAGFAIGFAAFIVIALYASNEFNVDKDYAYYKRIYRLIDGKQKRCAFDYNLNALLASKNPEIEASCPLEFDPNSEVSIKYLDQVIKIKGQISTSNSFFNVFSVKILKTRGRDPFLDKNSVVITESLVKKIFGKNEDPIGKSITVSNEYDAVISAVCEDLPVNSSLKVSIFVNSENEDRRFSRSCSNHRCINPVNHYLLIKEGVNSSEVIKKLNHNIKTYQPAIDSIDLQELSAIYMDNSIIDNDNLLGNKNLTLVFIAVGILIVILSTINYLNYNLSLQFSKLKEIGIKRINGASKGNLIGYLLTEVSVSIFISVDLAFLIVALLNSNINGLLDKQLSLGVILNPTVFLSVIGIIAFIILINCLTPFYILSKFNSSNFFTLKHAIKEKSYGKNMLTLFQFIVAISLLTCVFVIWKQLKYVQDVDLGFCKENTIRVSLPYNFTKQDALKQEVDKLPFVESSSLSSGVPGGVGIRLSSNDSTAKKFMLETLVVDDDFLKTMKLKMLEGRWFMKSDNGEACIMTREAIKQFNWNTLSGKRFDNGKEGGFEIIGVVSDFHIESLRQAVKPICLISSSSFKGDRMPDYSIRITQGDFRFKLNQIEQVWEKIIPGEPMDYAFYDSMFDSMYRKEKMLGAVISIFSLIAIILSCMGIFGQVLQACVKRTKEIGIRKVNGAGTWDMVMLINFNFVKIITIAFVIACPVSYYIMNKWLQNFAYKTPLSWWVFLVSGLIVLLITCFIVSWQSWRTASRNPIEALRYE